MLSKFVDNHVRRQTKVVQGLDIAAVPLAPTDNHSCKQQLFRGAVSLPSSGNCFYNSMALKADFQSP